MRQVQWMGMIVRVPPDWEIVRHAISTARGRLAWVDRHRQRMELAWQASAKRPATDQVFEDYRQRDLQEDAESTFKELRGHLGWIGYRRISDDFPYTRAGRYEAHLQRWVELVIPWDGGYDAALERTLLNSYEAALGPTAGRRWEAFGLDLTAPADWALTRVAVKPGEVLFAFARDRSEAFVRRLGMLEMWYDGPLEAWLGGQIKAKEAQVQSARHRGHEAATAVSAESVKHWRRLGRLLGRERQRSDLAWIDRSTSALVHVWTLSTAEHRLAPSDLAVTATLTGAG